MSSALALVVDPHDPTPPYEQLRRQLLGMVIHGALPPGQRLPPLRQLAGDLGLAVGTVARTYRELEAAGILVSRRGGGTRVAQSVTPAPEHERREHLAALAARYAEQARSLGFDGPEIRSALDAWLASLSGP